MFEEGGRVHVGVRGNGIKKIPEWERSTKKKPLKVGTRNGIGKKIREGRWKPFRKGLPLGGGRE